MTSSEEDRVFGDRAYKARSMPTGARCPSCRRYGMTAVWRRLKDRTVQCWGECPSCKGTMPGGTLPAGSGEMEVETRILERAQKEAAR